MDSMKDWSAASTAHPGYVRLVLPGELAAARAACRKFSQLCDQESARAGLILAAASGSGDGVLERHVALATSTIPRGFKLAIVAQGPNAERIYRLAGASAAQRKARAKLFSSEHHAAAWLMT